MTCGERIKLKRKELGLNQTELADKVGLKFSTISKYEKNEISIPASNLKDIANVLNVSVDYLLGNTSILNPKQYLENVLLKYNLTESEYTTILNDFLENSTINFSTLNSNNKNTDRIKKAYYEIFNVYINYLESAPLDNDINIEDESTIKKYLDPIDNSFIEMLKTLNKDVIIRNTNSDIFSTVDVPKKYPVLGKISAGLPILALENIEDYSYAPSSKIQKEYDYFFLRVKGDSMNLKFPDGCLLLVQRQPTLENGQIGVIRINGDDATVKRFKEENNLIILEPMSNNPIHQVQIYDPSKIKVEIIGKVISYTGDVN